MTPLQIQQRWESASGAQITQEIEPHPRRRHGRTLHSERITNARNSRKLIHASWVGPKEVQTANHRYQVRIDL